MLIPIIDEMTIHLQDKGALLKYLCHAEFSCKVIIVGDRTERSVVVPRRQDDTQESDGDFDIPSKHVEYLGRGMNLILNEPGPVTDTIRLKMLATTPDEELHLFYKKPAERVNGNYPYAHITFVDLCLTSNNKYEEGMINVSHNKLTGFTQIPVTYEMLRTNIMSRSDPNIKFTGSINSAHFTMGDCMKHLDFKEVRRKP